MACGPPVYAFGFAEARTEADPPEEHYGESMDLLRRADLRVGRVIQESNAIGSQTLRLLGADLGPRQCLASKFRPAILCGAPNFNRIRRQKEWTAGICLLPGMRSGCGYPRLAGTVVGDWE
jgi:hypothetical protein